MSANGPLFRVVRRFLREGPESLQDVVIYVLSAKHGLVSSTVKIEDYDERMTPDRAAELQDQVLAGLQKAISEHQPDELFLCLGRDYLRAVEGYEQGIPSSVQIRVSHDPSALKQSVLKAWLWGRPISSRWKQREESVQQPELSLTALRSVQIRGVTLALSTQDAIDLARRALSEGWGEPDRYRAWYARVDDRKVSPKWWVSYLSGLPVSTFVADEARRVLRALRIEVLSVED